MFLVTSYLIILSDDFYLKVKHFIQVHEKLLRLLIIVQAEISHDIMSKKSTDVRNISKTISKSKMNSDSEEGPVKENNEFLVKYHGKEYEISGFLKKHPGGSKILQPFKGLSIDDVLIQNPHSEAALHIFQEFVKENKDDYDSIEVSSQFKKQHVPNF